MSELKLDKRILKLGKQEKPLLLRGNKKLDFYDNYIFKIKGKLIYVHRYRDNLKFKFFKELKYKDALKLSKWMRLEIEELVKEAK